MQIAVTACRLCQKYQGKDFRKEAKDRRAEVQQVIAGRQQIEQAEETVKFNPDNGEANLLLGRWYCLSEKDWQRGLSHLAKGSDVELKRLASLEITPPPADAERQVALGDTWWNAGQSRGGDDSVLCLSRAAYWYRQAIAKTPFGLMKIRMEKRLAEIASPQPSLAVVQFTRHANVSPLALMDRLDVWTMRGVWTAKRYLFNLQSDRQCR